MTKYVWHMDGNRMNKIIERIEEDREKKPISLKDVFKKHFNRRGYKKGGSIIKKMLSLGND
jgi:capsule polysaccharide modification protein KpsS